MSEPESPSRANEASALAELALCENLSQTSGWAARWSSQLSGADAALLWAPDAVHPLFLCIGAHGDGTSGALRRSVSREAGIVRDMLRDRRARVLEQDEFLSRDDPWLKSLPASAQTCIAVPLEAEGIVVGLLALLFASRPQTQATLSRLDGFLRQAAPALARALRAERKTVGMLHAIERLTNLYDLSKAFGSTIEWPELTALIARKAADFAAAEVASLWILEPDTHDVALAATVVNENYEVENAPEALGASAVGDVLADQQILRRNRIDEDDAASQESPGYPIRSLLAVPLIEDEAPMGALVLVNKRGRHPEFSEQDEELLQDLGRQAVRALRNARRYEAEKKVEELDALLVVSREITATLDLDRVMQSIVNATAALIQYDRCSIAIMDRGRLRIGAISGALEIDRGSPEIQRLEELLQWVFLSGSDVNVTAQEDGTLVANRAETEEKFRAFFRESGLKAFYAAILKDEEGKLGILGFECREPILFDEETRDLLTILVNQATVAVRNAQLYQQIPLAGFWKPLLEKRRKLLRIPRHRRIVWGTAAVLVFALLFLVPWRLRIAGPARVLPGRRSVVAAGVDGMVNAVFHREGDAVGAGTVIATLEDERERAELADAQAAYQIAESQVAKHREAGNAAALFEARSRMEESKARVDMELQRLDFTRLKAPAAGVIVTPRLEERVGQKLTQGAEFCVVADVGTVTVEVAVPEEDSSLIHAGQAVDLKLNPYPTSTFHGNVALVGARIHEDGKDRFVIAEVTLANPNGQMKTGMLGRAKILAGHRRVLTLLFRRPARWLYAKLWPILP